jgi:hypothetical protein
MHEVAQNPSTAKKSSLRCYWPAREILRPGNLLLFTALLHPIRLTQLFTSGNKETICKHCGFQDSSKDCGVVTANSVESNALSMFHRTLLAEGLRLKFETISIIRNKRDLHRCLITIYSKSAPGAAIFMHCSSTYPKLKRGGRAHRRILLPPVTMVGCFRAAAFSVSVCWSSSACAQCTIKRLNVNTLLEIWHPNKFYLFTSVMFLARPHTPFLCVCTRIFISK